VFIELLFSFLSIYFPFFSLTIFFLILLETTVKRLPCWKDYNNFSIRVINLQYFQRGKSIDSGKNINVTCGMCSPASLPYFKKEFEHIFCKFKWFYIFRNLNKKHAMNFTVNKMCVCVCRLLCVRETMHFTIKRGLKDEWLFN
jgi:hypothetical protein